MKEAVRKTSPRGVPSFAETIASSRAAKWMTSIFRPDRSEIQVYVEQLNGFVAGFLNNSAAEVTALT